MKGNKKYKFNLLHKEYELEMWEMKIMLTDSAINKVLKVNKQGGMVNLTMPSINDKFMQSLMEYDNEDQQDNPYINPQRLQKKACRVVEME